MSNKNKPSLDEHIAKMQTHKMPERDLWQGIEHALLNSESSNDKDYSSSQSVKNRKWFQRPSLALAASVCLFCLVAYVSFESGKTITGQELVQQLSTQHAQTKASLLVSLQGQPTTTQNWEQQIIELDEAATAIKKALKNEPNNPALLKMLKRVHEQQIALIERVHAPAWQQI